MQEMSRCKKALMRQFVSPKIKINPYTQIPTMFLQVWTSWIQVYSSGLGPSLEQANHQTGDNRHAGPQLDSSVLHP